MTDRLDDARWRAAIDASLGDDADAHQRAFVATYVPEDPAARIEHALLAELATTPTDVHAGDSAIVDAAVARFLADRPVARRSHVGVAVASIAAAVVIAAAGWWMRPRAVDAGLAPSFGALATIDVPSPSTSSTTGPATTGPATPPTWVLEQGELVVEPAIAAVVPLDVPTRARSRSCLRHADAEVCVEPGAELIARAAEGSTPEVELVEGAAKVVSSTTTAQMQVVVGGTRVAITGASEVVVTIERRAWTIAVTRGRARIDRDGTTVELVGGQRLQGGGAPSRPSPRDADDLLVQARTLRQSGDLDGAARAYTKLVDTHRGSTVAHTAQVSLGEVHLERGRPKPALAAFDRYLRRGGALAEEASYGRIRALRALGRDAAVQDAIAAFERQFPGSAYTARLRSK